MRVLLVTMPFATTRGPSLALSLLKARLNDCDVACDVAYLNLAFAAQLGTDSYERIASGMPEDALAGEWVFSECAFGGHAPASRYESDMLHERWLQPFAIIEIVRSARALAADYMDRVVDSMDWSLYDVIGFTSSCHQNLASLALAARLKRRGIGATIVFGGANWDGEMGAAQHRLFTQVDVAVLGEADTSFPSLVKRLALGLTYGDIPGVLVRAGGSSRLAPGRTVVADLDSLPLPDFSDFFDALRSSGLGGTVEPVLPMEASRGCWWASREPCFFCGQNGSMSGYRSKSGSRILSELKELDRQWPGHRFELVDNVASPLLLREVLPQLVNAPLSRGLFLEARPEIDRKAIEYCAKAGITLQIGIESLSDHVLSLMNKGAGALQSLRLLLWCRANGVRPAWNVMYGVPGEEDADYEQIVRLLPSIRFLEPPRNCGRLSLNRFSPYFERAADFGFSGVRPVESYSYVYPFSQDELADVAYSFDYDICTGPLRCAHVFRLRMEVEAWQKDVAPGELRLGWAVDGSVKLVDSRKTAAEPEYDLDPLDEFLYLACRDILTRGCLLEAAAGQGWTQPEVDERLERFVDLRLMASAGDSYLSLALPASTSRRSV